MRATSAYCRRNAEQQGFARGFTLLELLVVLALVALLTGMVAPAALRGLDAARERAAVADLSALLAGLPMRAFQRGEPLQLDSAKLNALLPLLPDGWRVQAQAPLRYSASGVAEGGEVTLRAPGQKALRWRIAPGTGAVDAPAR